MNPTKRKEISRLTAEKLGRDFNQVDEIVAFYYRTVQKKLSAMNHIAVKVPNMGTFVLKKKRVETKIERYTRFMEKIDETSSIKAFELKQAVRQDINKYEAALNMMQQEEDRKMQVRAIQREQYDAD